MFLEDNVGLSAACRLSCSDVKHLYAEAYQGPTLRTRYGWVNSCPDRVNINRFELQRRRVGRLNRIGTKFQALVRDVDASIKYRYLTVENYVRKHKQLQLQTNTREQKGTVGTTAPQEKENAIAKALQELYKLDSNLPQDVGDGPILPTSLKRLCPELRIGYCLRVPRG